jgi:hypothetical protein
MAQEERTFEDLLKEAPLAPAGDSVSLVGTLARSPEGGKFVLTLQDGSAVTLETTSVKNHTVLGTSIGQAIVRIDVDRASIPASTLGAVPPPYPPTPVPFTLALPHQVPQAVLAALQWPGVAAFLNGMVRTGPIQDSVTGFWSDKHPRDDGATNPGGGWPD